MKKKTKAVRVIGCRVELDDPEYGSAVLTANINPASLRALGRRRNAAVKLYGKDAQFYRVAYFDKLLSVTAAVAADTRLLPEYEEWRLLPATWQPGQIVRTEFITIEFGRTDLRYALRQKYSSRDVEVLLEYQILDELVREANDER